MKALLKKDFYVLWSGMRSLVLLVVVFALIPIGFQNTFAVLYAAMLPCSALAFDERSHWDQMALSMPYSPRDIVRSKYVLGWISAGSAFLFTALAQLIEGFFTKNATPISLLFVSLCGATITIALTLPLMFRFGSEKARLITVFILALICGGAGALSSILTMAVVIGHDAIPMFLLLGTPIAAVAINLISMPLAEKWYKKRK